jgi:VanZ family protein
LSAVVDKHTRATSNLPIPMLRETPRPRYLWLPVLAYMAVIFALSSISQVPPLPGGGDKNLHALLYGGLAVLLVRAIVGGFRRRVTMGAVLATVAIAAAYGVSDEIHQYFVPLRQADMMDVVADATGAAIAALGLYGWSALAEVRQRRGI